METLSSLLHGLLGIDPRALAWAMVGGVFGAPLAPQAGRVRQVVVFGASTCLCALGGTAAAGYWHAGAALWRDIWAAVLAVVFHPLTAALVRIVPEIVSGLAARYVSARKDGDQP